MAIIKKNELKAMDVKGKREKLVGLSNELMRLRSQVATRTRPENPGRIKEIRRTIARIHTYLKQDAKKTPEKKVENKKIKEVKSKKE